MINIKELIPKDKYDIETIEKLKNVDLNLYDLTPIMNELFEWTSRIVIGQ